MTIVDKKVVNSKGEKEGLKKREQKYLYLKKDE